MATWLQAGTGRGSDRMHFRSTTRDRTTRRLHEKYQTPDQVCDYGPTGHMPWLIGKGMTQPGTSEHNERIPSLG